MPTKPPRRDLDSSNSATSRRKVIPVDFDLKVDHGFHSSFLFFFFFFLINFARLMRTLTNSLTRRTKMTTKITMMNWQ